MCPPPPGPERRAPPHVEASGASGSGWPFPDARLGHSGLGGTNRSRAVARGRLAPTDHWGGRPAGRRTERRPPRCAQTLRLLRREPAGCRGTGSRGAPLRTQTPPPSQQRGTTRPSRAYLSRVAGRAQVMSSGEQLAERSGAPAALTSRSSGGGRGPAATLARWPRPPAEAGLLGAPGAAAGPLPPGLALPTAHLRAEGPGRPALPAPAAPGSPDARPPYRRGAEVVRTAFNASATRRAPGAPPRPSGTASAGSGPPPSGAPAGSGFRTLGKRRARESAEVSQQDLGRPARAHPFYPKRKPVLRPGGARSRNRRLRSHE